MLSLVVIYLEELSLIDIHLAQISLNLSWYYKKMYFEILKLLN